MNTKRSLLPAGLLVTVLVIVGSMLWYGSVHNSTIANHEVGNTLPVQAQTAGNEPLVLTAPPSTCGYCTHNLVGKSRDEVTQFVQDLARQQFKAPKTPQVLLARAITLEELPTLGLGCGTSFAAIEQPPLVLAIVKGEFDFRGAAPGFGNLPPPVPGKSRYAVYVIDAWAGSPTEIMTSEDGALVKKALGDASLPDDNELQVPSACATQIPTSQKYLHYGQAAPGFTVPPHEQPVFPTIVPPSPVETTLPVPPSPVETTLPAP